MKHLPFQEKIVDELFLTQHYIEQFSKAKNASINKSIQQIVKNKGKLLRPSLLIMCGQYVHSISHDDKVDISAQKLKETLASFSAILELIHISSLIHDDVLDMADIRRGELTLNNLNGNRHAVLIGDFLVAQALNNCYLLLHDEKDSKIREALYPNGQEILGVFLEGIHSLIYGEVIQNESTIIKEHNLQEAVHNYYEIIRNKTASLYIMASFTGALLTTSNAELKAKFRKIGEQIGLAYQVIDDISDFSPLQKREKAFQDLKSEVLTLPLLYLQNQANHELDLIQDQFRRNEFTQKEEQYLLQLLLQTGSIDKSLSVAKTHLSNVTKIISDLPPTHRSDDLKKLISYLINYGDLVVGQIHAKAHTESYLYTLPSQ